MFKAEDEHEEAGPSVPLLRQNERASAELSPEERDAVLAEGWPGEPSIKGTLLDGIANVRADALHWTTDSD